MTLVPTVFYGADKGETFVEKYRVAHKSREVEALKALVHWEGGSKRTRHIIKERLILHLDYEFENIEFRPVTGDEKFENFGYRPNLKPVGWLVMFFKPPKGDSRFFAKSFVIGEKAGEYFITIAEPKH